MVSHSLAVGGEVGLVGEGCSLNPAAVRHASKAATGMPQADKADDWLPPTRSHRKVSDAALNYMAVFAAVLMNGKRF